MKGEVFCKGIVLCGTTVYRPPINAVATASNTVIFTKVGDFDMKWLIYTVTGD